MTDQERAELVLERREQEDETPVVETKALGIVMMTPPIDESYWAYRVKLSEMQAVIGFPKFGTVGIGFAVEDDDWNTNLPYTVDAGQIAGHIAKNKGDEAIDDADVLAAIKLIQAAVAEDRGDA